MIIINSPQNPTGGMLSKQDLEAVAEMAIEHDLWVMSDEVLAHRLRRRVPQHCVDPE